MKVEATHEYRLTLTREEAMELRTLLGNWPEKTEDAQYDFSVDVWNALNNALEGD